MGASVDLRESVLGAWRTNAQVTVFLVERLPAELWEGKVPGAAQKTVRSLLAHMHNVRCRWIKTLGSEHGLVAPAMVDRWTVGAHELVGALGVSGAGLRGCWSWGVSAGGVFRSRGGMCGGTCRWMWGMC